MGVTIVEEREEKTKRIQALLKAVADKRDSGIVPKPKPEDFNGDEDACKEALELWRIEQDERVAQVTLDNPRATLTAREKANRVLRNCQKRRQDLQPIEDDDYDDYDSRVDENYVRKYPFPNYIDDPAPKHDDRPWAERFPYRESEKSKWLASDEARQQHKTACAWNDEFERWGKMSPEEFKALMDKQESDHRARMEQQPQYRIGKHLRGYVDSLLLGQENQQVNGERPGALQSAAVFLSS